MSVFVNRDTRLLVQGITGRDGSFRVTVNAGRNTRLRIWSPRDDMFGLTLLVR